MFSSIGVIGAGTIGRAIAGHALRAGMSVLISNSRGPETLTAVVDRLGPGARAVTVNEATAADLVVLAVPFVNVPAVGAAVANWQGKIVIDATNQFARSNPYSGRADIGDLTGSEWVAEHLPGAVIIKAFNALFGQYVAADPRQAAGRQIVFYAGDDAAAKAGFGQLLDTFGFAGVDLGRLREGGRLMQLDGPLSGLHALRQD
ncbi:NADPH-dependent F420 reductase [Micromonospora sp. BQ11]|uniref:NADPH-dependent F420 reductase n=1 Tax=Micromonospora sp. BQ11 TaxID=3452212 RepID=UPI003F8940DB